MQLHLLASLGEHGRGLRPIAEIQYLDYLLYALQIMSDDLATLYWRTAGGQKAPVIVRTRGHRLEGIWHSGSPMAGIINFSHGMHVLVPRDMTQAAGFYNTLLKADEPGLIIEVLNGYRVKERMPDNIAEMTVPLGVPEVIRPGADVTVVTYGACCRVALDAAGGLRQLDPADTRKRRLRMFAFAIEVIEGKLALTTQHEVLQRRVHDAEGRVLGDTTTLADATVVDIIRDNTGAAEE